MPPPPGPPLVLVSRPRDNPWRLHRGAPSGQAGELGQLHWGAPLAAKQETWPYAYVCSTSLRHGTARTDSHFYRQNGVELKLKPRGRHACPLNAVGGGGGIGNAPKKLGWGWGGWGGWGGEETWGQRGTPRQNPSSSSSSTLLLLTHARAYNHKSYPNISSPHTRRPLKC